MSYHCVRPGETDNGEDVLDVERGRLEGVRVSLFLGSSLSLFCFCLYLVLIIGLNQRFELLTTHHPIFLRLPLPASKRPTRPDMGRAIASPLILHKMTISLPTLPTFDVGRRSRNTSFDSTSNGNGRVKGMISSLERSSSSEVDLTE